MVYFLDYLEPGEVQRYFPAEADLTLSEIIGLLLVLRKSWLICFVCLLGVL